MIEVKLVKQKGKPVALVPADGCELSPCIDYRTGEGCHHHQGQEGDAEKGDREFVVCNDPGKK